MAKRPLRAWMRDKLSNHAKEAVQPAAEKKAMDTAYKRAAPLVASILEKKWPARDMKVLEKYRLISRNDDFKIQSPDGVVALFTFGKDDIPLTPTNQEYRPIFLGDARTYTAVATWIEAKAAYEAEREKRVQAFQALIRSAAHVEDVVEIWPEAAKLIPQTEMLAPVAPEQIAIIKADMRERKAA